MYTSDDKYLQDAKDEIKKWEVQKPGYLASVGNFILWPAEKAIELLIPQSVQDAVAKVVEGCLVGLRSASAFTFDREGLKVDLDKKQEKFPGGDYVARLKAADDLAKECWNWNVGIAAAQGGATGAAGFAGLAANIPALFAVTLREIQQVGACYGYGSGSEFEQEYVLQILRAGSSGDVKAKVEFIIALKQIEQILLKVSWRKMTAELAAKQVSKLSLMAAMRSFARSLGFQLTKRKALQTVPAIGAVVGASFDAAFVYDVGQAAYMSYRRRYIEQNEKLIKPPAS